MHSNSCLFISPAFSKSFQDTVSATFEFPDAVEDGSSFQLKINLNKGALTGFARITVNLPGLSTAVPVDTRQAHFTLETNEAKFIWMELPAEETITVILSLSPDKSISDSLILSGNFSYVEGNRKKEIFIGPDTLFFRSVKPKQHAKKPAVISAVKPNELSRNDYSGIRFSIQIASSVNSLPENYFRNKYNLKDPVTGERINGTYKYMTGSFPSYESASQHRKMIITRYKLEGIFIIAYENGRRIPVEEAMKKNSAENSQTK
ncbi:MAG: hypothetical protein HYY40_04090 [Bacteroidetes bacterium]|nr:hypothetical protein [Bacteroidota bacterium]